MSWTRNVRQVVPYVAGEQPKETDVVKLNTNENPYPPAPGVRRALEHLADNSERLRLYPDPDATVLVKALSDVYDVPENMIFVGVGSDDVLSMSFLTFFNSGKPVLFPDVTYSFYDVWANLYRIPYEMIPLSADWKIRKEDYIGKTNGGIIFPNPNAPTGIALDTGDIEAIVRANPDSVVIVDEAYVDFGAVSAHPLIRKYENVLIVQTFSKSRSMAGMRIGYAFGSPRLIGFLKDCKFSFNSYTLNWPSILCGKASLENRPYFADCVGKIVTQREFFAKQLRQEGWEVLPSKANFLFVRYPGISGEYLFNELRRRKIFVRHWNKPRIEDYLRITVGRPEDMNKLHEALKKILAEIRERA